MDILNKYKLYLIDKNLTFPEWKMCEYLLGGLGTIKENEDVYIDNIFIYNFSYNTFQVSKTNIYSLFESKFDIDELNFKILINLYIEHTYHIQCTNIIVMLTLKEIFNKV
jgi:hypothetical protein